MTGRLLVLIGLTLAVWIIAALPARWLGGGDLAILYSGTAVLLCLVPGVVALIWSGLTPPQPEQQLTATLGSASIRMFFVLGISFLLLALVEPYRGSIAFVVWILVFYLWTLGVETLLVLANRSSRQGP